MLACLLSHLDLVPFQHAVQLPSNVVYSVCSDVDETDWLLGWRWDLSLLNHPLVLCLLTEEGGGALRTNLLELGLVTAGIVFECGFG